MKLRVNDEVMVITGKDKGKTGKVTKVYPKDNTVIVTGINKYKRHLKKQGNDRPAGVVEVERPIDASKVMVVVDKKPTRIGFERAVTGEKTRVAKKTGQPIESKK